MNSPSFRNTYSDLPADAYVFQPASKVASPSLIALNDDLAMQLGLDRDWLRSESGLNMLAGTEFPDGAASIAQAYAGHQFGNWVPQLGDGRALLIGELDGPDGRHYDLQLKGSGPTPFSRNGDGRAALGPVLREYIVSEAMHRLGVPTTRALAAVATGQKVHRERTLPGGILTRVAASHIRVGTFQYFAARQNISMLQALSDHVMRRHYPDATSPLELLAAVVTAQARLIAKWLSVGFVHGVMNTDNMTISGETIDYGPCAFLDEYDPAKVFSSIDRMGRYAYGRQPAIAGWNLAQFASCLLPLMSGDEVKDIQDATDAVNAFTDQFRTFWLSEFGAKIGLAEPVESDRALIEELLALMAEDSADFTQTFDALTNVSPPAFLKAWAVKWQDRLGTDVQAATNVMRAANPVVIPRNHQIERLIEAAYSNDFEPFFALNSALAHPFDATQPNEDYRHAPAIEERVTQTFCGT